MEAVSILRSYVIFGRSRNDEKVRQRPKMAEKKNPKSNVSYCEHDSTSTSNYSFSAKLHKVL